MLSLESIFEKKCDEHDSLKLLSSQWHFDKELLSKALQDIVVFFPHYSRHDASHSKQIITNIERILSDRLINLTATDMWLLLEAAYSHDLGMVITQKQIDDIDSDEFESYIKSHVNDVDSEFHLFAKDWVEEKALLPRGKSSYLFINKYKQVLAEWYRQKHANNSSKYIRNPVSEIGLNSPRNELLPKRLFNTLADICEAHGKNFSDVLDLPHTEAGVGVDDCHPRYIACLLRMGDILDIDDNRFCPVMMNISGDSIPRSSLHHFEKHQSIKHLRIDSERIKIEVECENPDVYEITYDWFKWVEKEYYLQSQYWPKIVPNKDLGKLPSLSTPIVRIKKPYLILKDGVKPSFELNKNKILSMLRSAGLYNNKMDSIREVLQNSVDSVLISMWYRDKKLLESVEPFSKDFYDYTSDYKINFDYEKSDDLVEISIQDDGIGICRSDLINMLNVGSSNHLNKKNDLIKEMPAWLKPSGNFGIGLQSLFMITDEFKIETKSRITDECFEIKFSKKESKGISIKEISKSNLKYGARVSFSIKIEKHPGIIQFRLDNYSIENYIEAFNDYDITNLNTDLSDYEVIKIVEGVMDFNKLTPVKVTCKDISTTLHKNFGQTFYSKDNNLLLKEINFSNLDRSYISENTYFKGQKVKGISDRICILSCIVDFYGINASEFLTFDRGEILKTEHKRAYDKIINSALEFIDKNIDSLSKEERSFAAAFYFLHCNDYTKINDLYLEYIYELPVVCRDGKIFSLDQIMNKIKNNEIKKTLNFYSGFKEVKLNSDCLEVSYTVQNLLKLLLTKDKMFWCSSRSDIENTEVILWSHKDVMQCDHKDLRAILLNEYEYLYIGNRALISCWGKYRKLAINVEAPWVRIIRHLSYKEEYMILPFKFKSQEKPCEDLSDELIDWIYSSLINKIEKDEIKNLLIDLIDEMLEIFKDDD